jgi:hypothetical protein
MRFPGKQVFDRKPIVFRCPGSKIWVNPTGLHVIPIGRSKTRPLHGFFGQLRMFFAGILDQFMTRRRKIATPVNPGTLEIKIFAVVKY